MLLQSNFKSSTLIPKLVFAATTMLSLTFSFTARTLAQTSISYSGIATTTIQYPNAYGTSYQQQTIQTPVVCVISDPKSAGGLRESNNFNLLISFTNPTVGASNGAISMWSAAVANTATGALLIQYWQYQFTSGTSFAGRLTNNAAALSAAYNLVNFPLIIPPNLNVGAFPYPMANGTQITGVFSQGNRQLDVQISGRTTDLARSFVSNIRCVR